MDTTTTPTLQIERHLNGPRHAANGGVAAGTFAALLPGPALVQLRRKVPLDRTLPATRTDEGFEVHDDDRLIASVVGTEPVTMLPPVRPTRAEAEVAREAHPYLETRHPLSDCVVCGPGRDDGMHVTPGPLAAAPDQLSAPFDPPAHLLEDGVVPERIVWGSLDCVSYPAHLMRADRYALLGSLSVQPLREIGGRERLVAVGWTLQSGTRSHQTASALLDEDGAVIASARAVWVEVRHQRLARLVGRWL